MTRHEPRTGYVTIYNHAHIICEISEEEHSRLWPYIIKKELREEEYTHCDHHVPLLEATSTMQKVNQGHHKSEYKKWESQFWQKGEPT